MTVAAGTVPFRPEPLPQKSSSTYWRKDCVPTASALCVNRATVDTLRPTPWDIRRSAQVYDYRGMSYGEAVMGAVTWTTKKGRKVVPTARYSSTRGDFKAWVDGGKSCVVSISCQVTHNTLRETNDYTGNHSVSAHDYRWCTTATTCYCEKKGKAAAGVDHSEYLIEDPGTTTTGWRWWSSDLLYKAAEFRTGDDGIDCIVFPDTEYVSWLCVEATAVYKSPSSSAGTLTTLVPGSDAHTGHRTQNGGGWDRPGTGTGTGYAWVQIDTSKGPGWVSGRKVKQVVA